MKRKKLRVEIFADIICPWCYIGKKRLEKALQDRPQIEVELTWRGFLLNPSIPRSGIDRKQYLLSKFGHAASSVYSRIEQAGKQTGINFNFDAIKKTPDSRSIHELIIATDFNGYQLSELFYKAYFIDGKDISDKNIQNDILGAFDDKLHPTQEKIMDAKETLKSDLIEAKEIGIDGVPFFIFNSQLSLAGAHPEHILLTTIDAALSG